MEYNMVRQKTIRDSVELLVEMEMDHWMRLPMRVRHGAVDGTVDRVGVLVEALICLFVYVLLGEGGLEGEAQLRVGGFIRPFRLRVMLGKLIQRRHIWVVLHQFVKAET